MLDCFQLGSELWPSSANHPFLPANTLSHSQAHGFECLRPLPGRWSAIPSSRYDSSLPIDVVVHTDRPYSDPTGVSPLSLLPEPYVLLLAVRPTSPPIIGWMIPRVIQKLPLFLARWLPAGEVSKYYMLVACPLLFLCPRWSLIYRFHFDSLAVSILPSTKLPIP